MDKKYIQTAIDYKKNIAGKFVLVEGAKLKQRVDGKRICVTRKIDGHMQVVFWQEGKAFMLNAAGNQKADGIKCLDVFAEALKKSGVKSAIIAAELYLPNPDGRPRCGDVLAALADDAKKDLLCLAPFDIIELDGQSWKPEHYGDTHNQLCVLFQEEQVRPVQMRNASSAQEVQDIYDEWVVGEGAEGLVIHSESPIVWKVKPRHSIDAAIIGYTSGDLGIRDLMFAVRREDGLFQMFAVGSAGLSEKERKTIAGSLSKAHAESQYVLSDSRGIAYQMVRPEQVYELSVIELVSQGNDGKIRMNPLLKFDDAKGWLLEGNTPGVSVLGLTIVQERTDKKPTESDIRVTQLTDICPFEELETSAVKLEPSTLLERRVFKKESGGKVMIHKFLIWKTNKEASGRYPAYVFYHSDFSSGRKEMLKRDLATSSDEAQIRAIFVAEIEANVKKGWMEV
jgi:hypothetical protein